MEVIRELGSARIELAGRTGTLVERDGTVLLELDDGTVVTVSSDEIKALLRSVATEAAVPRITGS